MSTGSWRRLPSSWRALKASHSSIRQLQSCPDTAARQRRDPRSAGLGRHPGAMSTCRGEGSRMTTQELTVVERRVGDGNGLLYSMSRIWGPSLAC